MNHATTGVQVPTSEPSSKGLSRRPKVSNGASSAQGMGTRMFGRSGGGSTASGKFGFSGVAMTGQGR